MVIFCEMLYEWRYNTQPNDTQDIGLNFETQHNDTWHNKIKCFNQQETILLLCCVSSF
jgi:hypothetical protein